MFQFRVSIPQHLSKEEGRKVLALPQLGSITLLKPVVKFQEWETTIYTLRNYGGITWLPTHVKDMVGSFQEFQENCKMICSWILDLVLGSTKLREILRESRFPNWMNMVKLGRRVFTIVVESHVSLNSEYFDLANFLKQGREMIAIHHNTHKMPQVTIQIWALVDMTLLQCTWDRTRKIQVFYWSQRFLDCTHKIRKS